MGRTQSELGQALSSAELAELVAFDGIEPVGQRRVLDGLRLIASIFYNSNKGADQKLLMPEDFLKTWEPMAEVSPEEQMAQLAAYLEAKVED